MSGRKRHSIWQYFNESNKLCPTNKKAVCKKCGKTLQAMVVRLQKHHEKCENTSGNNSNSDSSSENEELSLAEIKRKAQTNKKEGRLIEFEYKFNVAVRMLGSL